MPLLDWLEGVVFLPLGNKIYLKLVTLMDELLEEFPQIEKVAVLYQVYSYLPLVNLITLGQTSLLHCVCSRFAFLVQISNTKFAT